MDEQMRPRPEIEWLQLRQRLEIEFGINDSDLKKYDEIPEDAVLAACALPRRTRLPTCHRACPARAVVWRVASDADTVCSTAVHRYEMMQLCRQFENACNQAYMQGNIRGFMHLDNGQESIPAMLADFINKDDIK